MTDRSGEVLVAILNNKADFALLNEHKWYRIPIASAPKAWPPRWLAFYQTKVFGAEVYSIYYYGAVEAIQTVSRRELFPNELSSTKSDRKYYKVSLSGLEVLPQPILSRRWRRIVFIPTTWAKFQQAAEINDLYNESPLEDRLWAELKRLAIDAERQFRVDAGGQIYMLDFAVFCREGKIDIETDGDTWHKQPDHVARDNERNNALGQTIWQVLRFNTPVIRDQMASYCVPRLRTPSTVWVG